MFKKRSLISRAIPLISIIAKSFSMGIISKISDTSIFPTLPINIISSIQWANLMDQFIFDKIFPNVGVPVGKGTVFTTDLAFDQLNIKPTRSWDTAPLVNTGLKPVNFAIQEIRRRYFVDPQKLWNMPPEFRNTEVNNGALATTRNIMIAFEYLASRTLFNASNWNSFTPVTPWSNKTASTPLTDLQSAAFDVSTNGLFPNTIVFDPLAWFYFWQSTEVRTTYPTTIFNTATDSNLRSVLTGGNLKNLTNIWVGNSAFTSSNEGSVAAPTRVRTWQNGVWVGYVDYLAQGDTAQSATLGVSIMGRQNLTSRRYNDVNLDPQSEFVENAANRGFVALDRTIGKFINSPY